MSLESMEDIGKKYSNGVITKGPLFYHEYEKFLAPLRDRPLKFLEMGVYKGTSLQVWSECFPNATIIGMDLDPLENKFDNERVCFEQGDQRDTAFLDRISSKYAPEGWDIIIDDASHIGEFTKISFWHLIHRLKPGGLYFIEDWATGYWEDWPDGARYDPNPKKGRFDKNKNRMISHDSGMVGFIKQLVDEVGRDSIKDRSDGKPERLTLLEHMYVRPGFVLIKKMSEDRR